MNVSIKRHEIDNSLMHIGVQYHLYFAKELTTGSDPQNIRLVSEIKIFKYFTSEIYFLLLMS